MIEHMAQAHMRQRHEQAARHHRGGQWAKAQRMVRKAERAERAASAAIARVM